MPLIETELGNNVDFSCSVVQAKIAAALVINRQQSHGTDPGHLFDQEESKIIKLSLVLSV